MKGIMQQMEEIHALATDMGIKIKDLEQDRQNAVAKIFEVERDLIDLQKAQQRENNSKN